MIRRRRKREDSEDYVTLTRSDYEKLVKIANSKMGQNDIDGKFREAIRTLNKVCDSHSECDTCPMWFNNEHCVAGHFNPFVWCEMLDIDKEEIKWK